jgi:hypothetical protein
MDVNKIKVISARLKIELDNIQKLYDILMVLFHLELNGI